MTDTHEDVANAADACLALMDLGVPSPFPPPSQQIVSTDRVSEVGGDVKDKDCDGCGRSCLTGAKLWDGEEEDDVGILWALPEKRGAWCKICFKIWRLILSKLVSLSYLKAHLRDRTNRENFNLYLICWVILLAQGNQRPQKVAVLELVDIMRTTFGLFGLPVSAFVVTPLSDLQPASMLDPARLVTMQNADGRRRLGYFATMPDEQAGSQSVSRPRPASPAFLGPGRLVSDDHLEDAALVSNLFTVGDHADSLQIAEDQPDEGNSRVEQYFQQVKERFLVAFKSNQWAETVKESHFKKYLDKMNTFRQEAALFDNQEDQLEFAVKLETGLTACKLFMRAYRYLAAVKKISLMKVLTLEPTFSKVWHFLRDEAGIEPALTLRQLRLKCLFLEAFRNHSNFIHSLEAVMKEDVLMAFSSEAMATLPKNQQTTLEIWLRKTFCLCVQHFFGLVVLDPDDDARRNEVAGLGESFSENIHEFMTESEIVFDDILGNFPEDVNAVITILRAESGTVSSRACRAAKDHIFNTPRCSILCSIFQEAAVGQEFLSALESLLEVSAQDEVGDRRCQSALLAILDRQQMIYSKFEGRKMIIRSNGLVFDGSIWSIFEDVCAQLLECKRVWSHARCDEAAVDEGKTFAMALQYGCFSAQIWLYCHLQQHAGDQIGSLATVDYSEIDEEKFACMRPQLAQLYRLTTHNMFSLEPQQAFANVYKNMLEKAKEETKDGWLSSIFTDDVYEALSGGCLYLGKVIRCLRAFGAFAGPNIVVPSDKDMDATAWQSIPGEHDDPQDFLSCAIGLLHCVRDCDPSTEMNLLHLVKGFDQLDFDMPQKDDSVILEVCRLQDMFTRLRTHPFVDMCEKHVVSKADCLLEAFAEHVEIAAICKPKGDWAEVTVLEMACSCVDTKRLVKTLPAAASWFASGQQDGGEHFMPCLQMGLLWQKMADSFRSLGRDSLVLGFCCAESAECTLDLTTTIVEFLGAINTVMAALGYLVKLASGEISAIAEYKLKPSVSAALRRLELASCTILEVLSGEPCAFRSALAEAGVDFFVDLDAIDQWAQLIEAELHSDLKLHFCQAVMTSMDPLIEQVEKCTPDWSYIINHETYSKDIAKRKIWDSKLAAQLQQDTPVLFDAISSLNILVGQMKCADVLNGLDSWKAGQSRSSNVYNKAKDFLKIRACVNAVQVQSGKDAIASATKMLTVQESLPASMVTALKGVLCTKGGLHKSAFSKRAADEDRECIEPKTRLKKRNVRNSTGKS